MGHDAGGVLLTDDQGAVLAREVHIDVVDADNFHAAAADGYTADELPASVGAGEKNICRVGMIAQIFVIFGEAVGKAGAVGDGEGVADADVVRCEALNAAQQGFISAVAVIGFGEGTVTG